VHDSGVHHVEFVMGTAVSIDIARPAPAGLLEETCRWLHEVDRRFSTYRSDSEVSRLDRGELKIEECSPDLRAVLDSCAALWRDTDGFFDVYATGRLDPSGYVKGWSVEVASARLAAAGAVNHCINAGGDVRSRGRPDADPQPDPQSQSDSQPPPDAQSRPPHSPSHSQSPSPSPSRSRSPSRLRSPEPEWRIGIRHPWLPDKLSWVVGGTDFAVATSGTYERGWHVINPRSGEPARTLRSVTVVGPDLALADAYSTAAVAMGRNGVAWLARLAASGYESAVVTENGQAFRSEGLPVRPFATDSAP
jgi:thiamine biosynthesis lipoprotein